MSSPLKLTSSKILLSLLKDLRVGGFWSPYLTYLFISLIYASVAGFLVSFVEPLAAGSGIAEIKTYLNGIHIKGLLTVRLHTSEPDAPLQAYLTYITRSLFDVCLESQNPPFS